MRSKYSPEDCDAIVGLVIDYTFPSGNTYKARVFACHPDIGMTIVSDKYQQQPNGKGHFDKDAWLFCNHLALSPLRREDYKARPWTLQSAIRSFDAVVTEIISTGRLGRRNVSGVFRSSGHPNPCAFR